MQKSWQAQHEKSLPNVRQIRRSCSKELYRTIKRLNKYVPSEKVSEAEQLYFRKVALHLQFIAENGSNRKLLADWWDEHVCDEIAQIWDVDRNQLSAAFRSAFGG